MFKFISVLWHVWGFISPIYKDIMVVINEARTLGLTDDAARKRVFQTVTDIAQARGLSKIPDSVLNTGIELTYQIYLWKKA